MPIAHIVSLLSGELRLPPYLAGLWSPERPHGSDKGAWHMVFYRVVNVGVIEVVQLLHAATEMQLPTNRC